MTDARRKPGRWIGLAIALVIAATGIACDGAPSGPADDANVRIDLTPVFASLGAGRAGPCDEADTARLWVTELDHGSTVQRFTDSVPHDTCIVSFTVTVKGGQTRFVTLVTGDKRPLLFDIRTQNIQDDDWTLPVQLTPVSAITVTLDTSQDTTGVADTLSYTYTVTTEESPPEGYGPFAISPGETDVQLALSAGMAAVELFGAGMCNVGPSNPDTISIPADSSVVRDVTGSFIGLDATPAAIELRVQCLW